MVKINFIKDFFAVILLVSLSCNNQGEKAYKLDFSGLEHFLTIAAVLENDQEPSAEQWEKLFVTPGYEVLTESEFSRGFFKERFRIAFMPSMADELDLALKREEELPFHMQFVHHYVRANEKRTELAQFMKELKTNAGSVMEKAAREAKNYLPPIEDQDYIAVSFLIFANDARGYTPLVIDMLFAIELGGLLPVLIGHELHHYYRNKILAYNPEDIDKEDKNLIWVMDQIHCEGIADQIDKKKLITSEDGPLHFFSDPWDGMVDNAPEFIEIMDDLLCRMAESPQEKEELSLQLRSALPMSGHPVGYYMTNVIIERAGKKELIKKAGNPFAFFRLYNQTAMADECDIPKFSDDAMRYITELEAKYVL